MRLSSLRRIRFEKAHPFREGNRVTLVQSDSKELNTEWRVHEVIEVEVITPSRTSYMVVKGATLTRGTERIEAAPYPLHHENTFVVWTARRSTSPCTKEIEENNRLTATLDELTNKKKENHEETDR